METLYDNNLSIDDMILIFKDKLPKISIEWNRFLFADLLDRNLFRILPSQENPQYIEMKVSGESVR